MSTAGHDRAGFNLIELVVVIAIVGVLVALLLPVIARGKAKANQIQCVSNLHQLGLALTACLADDHAYPMYPGWMVKLQKQGLGMPTVATNFLERGVWRCPSARFNNDFASRGLIWMSYGYNAYGVLKVGNNTNALGLLGHKGSGPPTPIRESEVAVPSDMMAIGDSFDASITLMREPTKDLVRYGNTLSRHDGKANVLFCDGHVQSPSLVFLFDDTSDRALIRWNRDHLPHRDLL
jgi:prepilin-type processing-associated H-X9-DG protein/prepilin-type N-terminal cleavage/methylation domain-containing protein